MNKVLLVWDCDSSLKIYQFNVENEIFEKLKKCHERYVNINENEELLWLCEWLMGRDADIVFDNIKREGLGIAIVMESTLIVCGFAK